MPGTQINDRVNLNRRGIDVNKTVEAVTEMYSQMIFKHGFIHCDPHPGNILINKQKNGDPEIVLLDHGLYQTINDEFRYHYALLWKSLVKGDISNIRLAARYLNVEDMFPLLSGKLLIHPRLKILPNDLGYSVLISLRVWDPIRFAFSTNYFAHMSAKFWRWR